MVSSKTVRTGVSRMLKGVSASLLGGYWHAHLRPSGIFRMSVLERNLVEIDGERCDLSSRT